MVTWVVITTRTAVASTEIATADAACVIIEVWHLLDSGKAFSLTSAGVTGITRVARTAGVSLCGWRGVPSDVCERGHFSHGDGSKRWVLVC